MGACRNFCKWETIPKWPSMRTKMVPTMKKKNVTRKKIPNNNRKVAKNNPTWRKDTPQQKKE